MAYKVVDYHDEILKLHSENPESIPQIAKKFNVNISTIYDVLRKHNVKPRRKFGPKSKWSKIVPQIIKLHKDGLLNDEISKKLNISATYPYIILKREGYKIELRKRIKYKVNQAFFEKIDTEEKAYFLGLLYADGYISRQYGSYGFKIALKYPDKHILDSFCKSIGYTGKLLSYFNDAGNRMYKLDVFSKKMSEDLEKLGCFQCKSAIIRYPTKEQVADSLIHHFIRGFFDGDGTIWNTYNPSRKDRWCAGMTSNKDFISDVINKFLIPNNIKSNWVKKSNPHYSDLTISGNIQIREFLNIIYKDATIFLIRKHNLYKKFLTCHDEILSRPKLHWVNRKRNSLGRFE